MAWLIDTFFTYEGLIALFAILFIRSLLLWWKDPLRCIPGSGGLPIFGNTFDYSYKNDALEVGLRKAKKFGPIFKEYMITTGSRVVISDPGMVKHVLVTNCTNYIRGPYLKKLCPLFGNGLLTSNGKLHAFQRKTLTPTFSLSSVKDFLPIFVDKGTELVKYWTEKIKENNGISIESRIREKFTHLTLDVIGLCAFGYNFNCTSKGHTEDSSLIDKIMCGNFNMVKRSLEILLPILKLIPSKERDDVKKAEKLCYQLIENIIESKKAEMKSGKSPTKKDLLQKIIEIAEADGTAISSKDLIHQVFTFMVGGHETTSNTLTWATFLFSKYPEIQNRARDEVEQILGGRKNITDNDVEKMTYLSKCINETLRTYPVGVLFGRQSIKEDQLGPYKIPGNTIVMIAMASLHNDEKFLENPSEFNPDRFDNKGQNDPLFPYYFLPFSRGPRTCIGYRLALMEMKVILAMLLKNFSFKLGKGQSNHVKTKSQLTLQPDPAPLIEIEAR